MVKNGLNVAVVTPRYPPISSGGGEKSAQLLATTLTESSRVDDVTVFSFDGEGKATRDGVDVHRLGAVSPIVTECQNFAALVKLRGQLPNFDIVHGYNMELHPAIGYLSSKEDVPSVATLNSYHFFPSAVTNTTPSRIQRIYEFVGHPTTGRVMRHYVKQIDAFVALSRAIRAIYEANGFSESRFEHIPNMIDLTFDPSAAESVTSNGRSLLYVGTLTENKGVNYLIRAVSSLSDEYRLRIVGEGPQEERLRALARDMGVADRVEFSGWVPYDQIPTVYAATDLFVHPGIWPEPLNRTVLEAMQAGLPVVCTDIGGPPEVIPDEEFLCEPGDSKRLAAAIKRAHRSDRDIGAENRQHVMQNFTPSAIVPRIVDLYEELVTDG